MTSAAFRAKPPPRDARRGRDASATNTPVRVAIADDRALVRNGLVAILGGEQGIEVLPAGGDASTIGWQPAAARADVLVLDLALSSRTAVTLIARLRDDSPATAIVVLAGEPDPAFAGRALAAGAVGFVAKAAVERDLPAAIRCAGRGEPFISAGVAASIDATRRSFAEDGLTAREVEVLRLIALGHTSAEVARTLDLSPRTVETHRARIHKKLGLSTRFDLVSYALRRRLLRT
jgi:two-component system, NarL family, response regulator NreC